jgi:hypothetical protein
MDGTLQKHVGSFKGLNVTSLVLSSVQLILAFCHILTAWDVGRSESIAHGLIRQYFLFISRGNQGHSLELINQLAPPDNAHCIRDPQAEVPK